MYILEGITLKNKQSRVIYNFEGLRIPIIMVENLFNDFGSWLQDTLKRSKFTIFYN